MSINTMEYKGYTALIEYSAEDECLVGHVIGIYDRIGFHGESIAEITQSFHDALDCYLDACESRGKQPEQPKSGKLSLRLPVELHAYISQQSEVTGESINNIIVEAVRTFRDAGRRSAERPANSRGRGEGRRKARAMTGAGERPPFHLPIPGRMLFAKMQPSATVFFCALGSYCSILS